MTGQVPYFFTAMIGATIKFLTAARLAIDFKSTSCLRGRLINDFVAGLFIAETFHDDKSSKMLIRSHYK